MNLQEIPRLLGCESVPGLPDVAITAVTEDSRRVRPGSVFVAAPGTHADGHDYAQAAVNAGAVAVLGSRPGCIALAGVPYVHVGHARAALGLLAHALAGDPSRQMTVAGITGTNGKTTCVQMAKQVLMACGHNAAAFGTLGYEIAGEVTSAKHTTPFGEDLAAMFGRALEAGVSHVVMEASSHALEQDRVAGIDFDAAAVTNLSEDHLDYHTDMKQYRQAKMRLFEGVDGPDRFTVVNSDDPSASWFINASRVPCYTFGRQGDCRATALRPEFDRTCFTVETPWGACAVETALLGRHNVSNALCVIALCGALGLPLDGIAQGIAELRHVPGRFERVDAGQDFQVIVDYAHTEDGLENVLTAAREVGQGRIIVVFGCGGDRDRTKRPKMGAAAARLADFAIVTSDNPRTEDADQIIAEIERGVQAEGKRRDEDYRVVPDRAEAIGAAIAMAAAGDVVLLAGKGHEDYQIFGTKRIHFDDREHARAALEER